MYEYLNMQVQHIVQLIIAKIKNQWVNFFSLFSLILFIKNHFQVKKSNHATPSTNVLQFIKKKSSTHRQ